ncbi:cytochrome c biogenesis factor [Streptomyces aurantiacus]|nr:cytochrome c biogenesis factor [Streptomyces aurantiacus]
MAFLTYGIVTYGYVAYDTVGWVNRSVFTSPLESP